MCEIATCTQCRAEIGVRGDSTTPQKGFKPNTDQIPRRAHIASEPASAEQEYEAPERSESLSGLRTAFRARIGSFGAGNRRLAGRLPQPSHRGPNRTVSKALAHRKQRFGLLITLEQNLRLVGLKITFAELEFRTSLQPFLVGRTRFCKLQDAKYHFSFKPSQNVEFSRLEMFVSQAS